MLAGNRTMRILPPLPNTVICPPAPRRRQSRQRKPHSSEIRNPAM
jgi:hypothetical protein